MPFRVLCGLSLGIVVLTGCDRESPPAANQPTIITPNADAQAEPVEPLEPQPGSRVMVLAIQGMTCQGCVTEITEEVGQLAGVDEVRVSLADRKAWIRVDEQQPPSPETIRSLLEEKGYRPSVLADDVTTQPATAPTTAPA